MISDNPKFSKDIFIPRKEAAGIKNGDKVIAVITDYGSGNKNPEGKIKENLGNIRHRGQIFWQSSRASESQVNFLRK